MRTETALARILVDGGRAVGVQTVRCETLRARQFVASGLNPHQTFLALLVLDESLMDAGWRDRAARFRYNVLAPLFGVYAHLNERPVYRAEGVTTRTLRADSWSLWDWTMQHSLMRLWVTTNAVAYRRRPCGDPAYAF